MLTGTHIAIIGGDARQIEVIKKLSELDAKVSLIGFDQLSSRFSGTQRYKIEEMDFSDVDAILLPVQGLNSEGAVDSVFSSTPILLSAERLSSLPNHCVIYTGIANKKLQTLQDEIQRPLVCLMDRDDVAIYNAIPTVEGTLMMVIQNTDFTIHSSNVAVLGFGRVGMSVARTFDTLGATVHVGARKPEQLARVFEMGLQPFYLQDIENYIGDADIVINTIPKMVLTPNVIAKLPSHTLIIDLASKPGGTDFRYAEKRGIKAILAPGLPGIVAPKTAGKIIANVVSQLLLENYSYQGEEQDDA